MAKLTRQLLKLFGESGASANFAEFGSQAASAPVKTKNIVTIQSLSAWLEGWQDAVALGDAPYLEDMNGLLYVFGYELVYLLQEGVAEFDATTTYYIGSIVKKTGTFELYGSLTNTNLGNALPVRTTDSNWAYLGQLDGLAQVTRIQRPWLVFGSGTTIAIADALLTGISGDVTIQFPDNEVRTTNDAALTTLDITRVAVLTGGGKQSGLDSGAVAANKNYYSYAVKATDSDDLIHVASLTSPLPANYGTLDGLFGANGWYPLGPFRYGASAILAFTMQGNAIRFTNSLTIAGDTGTGYTLASTGSATSLAYTYAAGSGNANIPDTVRFLTYLTYAGLTGGGNAYSIRDTSNTRTYRIGAFNSNGGGASSWLQAELTRMPAAEGVNVSIGNSGVIAIACTEWEDSVIANWP